MNTPPPSPIMSNAQYRYPKGSADINTRFACILLNYLQRIELSHDDMIKVSAAQSIFPSPGIW